MENSSKSAKSVKRNGVQWNSMQGIITIIILLFAPLLFYKCTDDSYSDSEKSQKPSPLKTRTCAAGSYSIDNGRIVFDDFTEFQQTLDFLLCASDNDIAEWSDEIEIETAGKAYREIMGFIDDDEISDEEFSDYLDEYRDKILVTQVYEDGVTFKNIQPLFPFLHEIFNLNGEFQIDTCVYKLAGNNFVSIVSPSLVSPSSVDEETETDTINKVFAHPFIVTALQGGCCSVSDIETHYYGSSPRKRLYEDYYIVDLTITERFFSRAGIGIDILAKSQKRKGIIINLWWGCHKVDLSFDFDLRVSHNLGNFGITSPSVFTFSRNAQNECKIQKGDGRFGPAFFGSAAQAPPPLSVCVDVVFEELINTEELSGPTATIDCD